MESKDVTLSSRGVLKVFMLDAALAIRTLSEYLCNHIIAYNNPVSLLLVMLLFSG